MRKTPILLRQHIGWHFTKHWVVQGKRKPLDTGAEEILKQKGIPVYKPEELFREKREFQKVEVVGYMDKPVALDNTHPDWHDRTLLSFKDNNVLLEGLSQAQIITKSVEIKKGLPDSIELRELTKDDREAAERLTLNSQLLDAEQKKLPKIKDPARPAWNFPRTYGITQSRRNKRITSKLLSHIESTSDRRLTKERHIFENLPFSFSFERSGNLVQLRLSGDFVLASSTPLKPVTSESTDDVTLPDIDPIDPLITLMPENIYRTENVYPIKPTVKKSHPHTLFTFFDREEVRNLYEEEVTDQQIFGRSLMKTFTAAASYARQRYGNDVGTLPSPVTLQCVQTDGQFFHLGVLQLNTLDLEKGATKNVWYQTPMQYLYDSCSYQVGRPVLAGFNGDIIKQLYGFYNNV
ncbi:unnamed protein product [Phaedon cochleariae]|uniref:Large ribosomal subunit protein mL37 n=1 Tax=Phaedon cochleariae TaxID=80249 RepID=A0A9P0GVF7_PHACE|nr:unnamed protein product [Phaedon cochleariae]